MRNRMALVRRDIQTIQGIEVLNTNQVICTVDKKQKFEAEFDVRIGRGFFTGDENKRADMPIRIRVGRTSDEQRTERGRQAGIVLTSYASREKYDQEMVIGGQRYHRVTAQSGSVELVYEAVVEATRELLGDHSRRQV